MTVDLGTPYLHFEQRGPVAWVTIDRPQRRNALTANMYFGIRRAVDRVTNSSSLHALVITGTGDVFAPGGELGGEHGEGDVDYAALLGSGVLPFDAVRNSPKPVIASVNGLCMGGGLIIALMCDLAVASDRATFGAPELHRGVADAYNAAILPEHLGMALARDLLFTGRRLSAEEAERHGLVARVVPHATLAKETERAVGDILQTAPAARRAVKRILNARYGAIDHISFDESVRGAEVAEGMAAFVEKRSPAWVPEEFRRPGRL
ncbi:MAG: enoyl-CoA hydratase/isomerase family protein [Acidimicrobiia bacterium]